MNYKKEEKPKDMWRVNGVKHEPTHEIKYFCLYDGKSVLIH